MDRILGRSIAATLGLALVLAAASAQADVPGRRASGCAAAPKAQGCRGVRPLHRPDTLADLRDFDRSGIDRLPPSRYVSLLILGIGY